MTRRPLAVAAALTAAASALIALPQQAQAAPPGGKDVTAVLFEWQFDSVAKACTDQLGPAGYGYVQVSPPQERIQGEAWWTGYQPVSYTIGSRLGNREQFRNMVATCHAAGVKVVADTVVNHMANAQGTGSAGSRFTKYDYPGLYGGNDFDDCMREITNYRDRWESQHCELGGLPDLDTGEEYVRGRIAGYMNDLLSLGVDGFRIDAAKHMAVDDLKAIRSRLSNPNAYIKQETLHGEGEDVSPGEYLAVGDAQEVRYAWNLKRVFTSEKLAHLKNYGEGWGYMPGDRSSVFVTNHDTERHGQTLSYKDGADYTLAHVFMLAWPYGSPDVHSGYAFSDQNAGSPNGGKVTACFSDGWTCQHAWREISSMVKFRNTASGTGVTHWWDNGNNAIAFGRGDKAFVAINHEGTALHRTFQTSLPAGSYCDVQSGRTVTVNGSGQFTANLGPGTAVALHVGARECTDDGGQQQPGDPGVSFGVNATTQWGQNIYVTGDRPELGNWNPAAAKKLDPATYPVWKLDIDMPEGTTFAYKYLRKDGGGNVTWESGANRTATVGGDRLVLNDTWRS
ncbi:alpha amylase C-terminal domain-containing protein [Streptomyces pactum]|uniref:Alpha-amylase n=1 Tax=Streptomyces pactum TaxID=68249 RepID=A0ABS0NTD6_9ACTN|nr:carbohydrate-binding module family 20 domain-containing protein [Streptomyces pactum]MBH5338327.1 alpha amylase C-terminal domain-containing protein [Streptomyces pactum]